MNKVDIRKKVPVNGLIMLNFYSSISNKYVNISTLINMLRVINFIVNIC